MSDIDRVGLWTGVRLFLKVGSLPVFRSHANQQETEHAHRHWPDAELADKPGRPIRLETTSVRLKREF